MPRIATLVLLVCCLLSSLVAAQPAEAGPGRVSFGPIDTEAVTGGLQNLGVQFLASRGTLFVTGRGHVTGGAYATGTPHTIYELDLAGTLLGSWPQTTSSPVWGHRDMASDGTLLFLGDEGGVSAFDPAQGSYVAGPQVQAAGGPRGSSFPKPVPGGLGVARALAFDPAGDGGRGSLWMADFDSALIEVALDGGPTQAPTVLTSHPNTSGWSLFGLAFDAHRGMLWGSTAPSRGDLVEIDPATGRLTGNRIARAEGDFGQGGLTLMERPGGGVGDVPFRELVSLEQGAGDAVVGYRLDLLDPGAGQGFLGESRIETDVAQRGFGVRPRWFEEGEVIGWRMVARPGGQPAAAMPLLLFAGLAAEATAEASTPGVPEFLTLHAQSVPTSAGATLLIGDGFGGGGVFAPVLPLGPHVGGAPAALLSWPTPSPLAPGEGIRLQAVVLDVGAAYGRPAVAYATNTAHLSFLGPACPGGTGFEGVASGVGSYPSGWTNSPNGSSTNQWQVHTGPTPSAGTGPRAAFEGSSYFYCESSGTQNSWPKTFRMDSSALGACSSGGSRLSFRYHLHGATSGSLEVATLDANGQPNAVVFSASGDRGDVWNTAVVPVTPDANGEVRVRFIGRTPSANNSWQSDIAIDDVRLR